MITFEILDPILCKTNQPKIIKPLVALQKEYWHKSAFSTERNAYTKSLIENNGTFLYGFLPRICKALDERKIPYEIKGTIEHLNYVQAEMSAYNLKPYQKNLSRIACDVQRGVLVSPTATGKTVIIGSIVNNLKGHKGLFLCHTISLVTQTYEEFEKMALNPSLLYGKEKDFSGDIVVSSIQTISKYPIEKICDMFDYVIVDECHHCASFSGTYYKLLTSILAPMRIGVTATLPKAGTEAAMALEGLIGPVIGEYTMEEALDEGAVARPRIKLIGVPKNANIQDLRKYQEIYKVGIVNNRMRNKLLARFLMEMKEEDKTALVYINQLEHIDAIVEVLDERLNFSVVQGNIENAERETIKKNLQTRKIDFVIASSAWREGVNIPSVNYIIFASGGKSEIATIQAMGRGLRRDIGKEEVILVDFLDQGRYLSEHCVERINVYAGKNWL